MGVSHEKSLEIAKKIDEGDLSEKPGWVRWSLHPMTTNSEVQYFLDALKDIIMYSTEWEDDYHYDKSKNEYYHKSDDGSKLLEVKNWFKFS
ncbi:MAG: hypothetical protein J7L04_05395 [Bacteroidales bacterium]|nr:hypothetical protein [Bacteroidales bacterium]